MKKDDSNNFAPEHLKKLGCELICYIVENKGGFKIPETRKKEYMFIEFMQVPEKLREKGYGTELLNTAIEMCKKNRLDCIVLDAADHYLKRWYESRGFLLTSTASKFVLEMYKKV